MSQKERVLAFLKKGNTLTPLQALRLFNSLRLGAIIFDLRAEGNNIATKMIETESHKRVAEYKLITKMKETLF